MVGVEPTSSNYGTLIRSQSRYMPEKDQAQPMTELEPQSVFHLTWTAGSEVSGYSVLCVGECDVSGKPVVSPCQLTVSTFIGADQGSGTSSLYVRSRLANLLNQPTQPVDPRFRANRTRIVCVEHLSSSNFVLRDIPTTRAVQFPIFVAFSVDAH
jgi:hypothetical protein